MRNWLRLKSTVEANQVADETDARWTLEAYEIHTKLGERHMRNMDLVALELLPRKAQLEER